MSPSSATVTSDCGLRIADCGMEEEGPIADAKRRARCSLGPIRNPQSAFRILLLAERQQDREQPIRAGDARGELPEEAQPGVHARAFSDGRHEQAALERRATRSIRLEERRVPGSTVVRQ